MKKRLLAGILMLVMLLGITGCGAEKTEAKPEEKTETRDDRVQITMYLWDKSMTKELTPWLEDQFPDIDFTFVVGYNTMAYYTDLTRRGPTCPTLSPAAASP